ncbi:hypothetical protein BCT40_15325 [Vibrio lentus]|uniref:type II toxin-antitoxin system YafO family toxin n=1 Tax=Vibrio lentus TaxID=136468 RepID=UPI000C850162|nr:type II toxin-antitoxin system YafO family toxin [Vibrio lentus]MCC4785826.1 type II toxin-antitoxin system YafO family toxin [Vibrio lentus]PME61634.1 hypothetical protein BCV33_22180 [Vibrio lentus]PMG65487.1 hypothetical protein BCU87_06050 [Vibrio lentus]PMJ08381.1 hypothetical protein BCU31_20675 [Vibrio lentus]PMM97113.1 hypothetical protein BCT40_15325 [Vibrio lentus]
MDTPFFKGKVFKHPAYIPIEDATYTKEFTAYWKNGFSQLIGKDGILPVPEIYSDSAIGRAHVEPDVKTNHDESSTEEAWYLWSIGETDGVPTSNSLLIYCVDEDRNACLLAYLDGGSVDSHEILKDNTFRRNIKDRATEFYTRQNSDPMPVTEHESLFGEKWTL